jgi:hypothetical protein
MIVELELEQHNFVFPEPDKDDVASQECLCIAC